MPCYQFLLIVCTTAAGGILFDEFASQSHAALGGYKVQGRTAAAAAELLLDAHALQEAGCFAVVLEMVPAPVAADQ